MATKIKVKKITDLAQLPAEDTIDIWSNVIPGAQDEDQIIVAHNTNVNNEGGSRTAVMHTNTMQLGELLKYIDNRLNKKYMSTESGEELKELVEQRLREAEDNMAKGNDTYSSNCFVDDSGVRTFTSKNHTAIWDSENGGYWRYTDEFVFKSTGPANCHLTIYRGTSSTSTITAKTNVPDSAMYARILIKTRNGSWKTICQQPVQCADGAFDIELHGYFYAGTVIKGAVYSSTNMNDSGSNIIFGGSFSYLQVTRFSTDKPFQENSFDWWVSNNNALSSKEAVPSVISSDGFLKFEGLYYHQYYKTLGKKANHFYDVKSKVWTRRYCTDAVYAKVTDATGANYFLGNTEGESVTNDKAGHSDDFSGKYYYISADNTTQPSVYMQTDLAFVDDTKVKGGYADSGGGWHNATLIQYVNYNELSTVIDSLPIDPENNVSVYSLPDLTAQFATPGKYHTFVYSGGLAQYSPANVSTDTLAAKYAPYMGTNARNSGILYVKSYDGTIGSYLREEKSSVAEPSKPTVTYSFIPPSQGEQRIHNVIRDYNYKIKPTDYSTLSLAYTPVTYKLNILNENIQQIHAMGAPYTANVIKGDAKTDSVMLTSITKPLSNWIQYGWALVSVDLKPVDGQQNIMIDDFGFASCPRLSSFVFPKGIDFTGRYTFAAPPIRLNYLSCSDAGAVIPNDTVPASRLTSVQFYHDGQGGHTHINGIDGDRKTWATFANCVSLVSTDIQYTDALVFGDHTFLSCTKLYKIEAPSCLTAFGNSVFAGCTNLSSVTLPSGLRTFGTKVFAGCPALTATNTYNSKTGYKYQLGRDYNITIQLSGDDNDYRAADGTSIDKNKIFDEIKGLVGCLQAEKAGQTSTIRNSSKGRRFRIFYANGDSGLVFNSICVEGNKLGVFTSANIIKISEGPEC